MQDKIALGARLLLGLIFFVFGLNGFVGFLPMPEMTGAAGQYMGGLDAAGYFFPVLKAVELVAGILLLSGFFVPLALVLLSPVVVQILLFHAFLAPEGLGLPIVIVILQSYLGLVAYRATFRPLLRPTPTPH